MFNKVNYTKDDVSKTETKDRIGNHLSFRATVLAHIQ
jgi:hypothetical protein